jgi:hypothetical protein
VVEASFVGTIGGMISMRTVRVLVAVLPQMSMATDRGRAPRSVRQKKFHWLCIFFGTNKASHRYPPFPNSKGNTMTNQNQPGQQSQNPNQKPGQQGQNPNQKPGQQTQNPGQGGKPGDKK